MTAIHLNELGIVCALGAGKRVVAEALFAADAPRGVAMSERWTPGRALALGAFKQELPSLDALPLALRSRNNALLKLALDEIRTEVDHAIAKYGAARIAIVLGTSTSGIAESERAQRYFHVHGAWPQDFHYAQQEMTSPAAFLAHALGTRGPAHVISTACSSSAKAIASGARLLRAGLADAVIAGGADSLCAFTIAGFQSLEAVSVARCNPFSANRCGINIGEGAALFLMTREPGAVRLEGYGESADAHHMSAPDPTGAGALRAIAQALDRAGIAPRDIDYINLHGTATAQNDAMESAVVAGLFGAETACSSTKPLTGHALGAAGAIEAALCWLTLVDNPQRKLPPHWWDGHADPALPSLHLVRPGESADRPLRHLLSQSFAFGGSNAALLLGAG
ncbi:MAG: beta-ketoacyl-[acyl-carrier-protein] synthase family protein [Lysobacteraceae bacterium]